MICPQTNAYRMIVRLIGKFLNLELENTELMYKTSVVTLIY